MKRKMRNKNYLLFLFTLTLFSCADNINENNNIPQIITSLKIANLSSYILYDVNYSSTEFGNIAVGGNKTMELSPNNTSIPIFFTLMVNGNPIQCKTNDIKSITEGSSDDWIIYNTNSVSTITGGINGTLNFVYNTLSKPILELSQNNIVIENDNPTSFYFGETEISTNIQRIFTIKNIGNLPLELNGTPVIESSNPVFAIPSQPTNTIIAPGSSIAFIIQYTPTVEREDTGVITVFNNSDSLFYTLKVRGNGFIPMPQITVKHGTSTILQSGEYNLGSVLIGEYKDVIFTIGNTGLANLTFETVENNRINLANNQSNFYSVTTQPSSITSILPGNTTTFTIRFTPLSGGSDFNTIVKIKTNSRDNDEYSFTVKGSSTLSVPTSVTAKSLSSNSANLSWSSVQGATSYNVYYGTSSNTINTLASSGITETTYTHIGILSGTTYHYNITAVDGLIMSNRSQSVSCITIPNVPTNLRSTATTNNSVILAWNTVTGANNYRIYSASSPTGNKTQIGQVNTTSFTHSDLQADTMHYYFVTAVNNSGESDFTNVLSVKTFLAPLSAPTGVSATAISTNSIQVTWNSVTGATGYRIYRATSATGTRTLITTVTQISHIDTGITARTYWYFITSLNSDNVESTLSSSASTIPLPAIPSNVIAKEDPRNGGIDVTWNNVSGSESYRIYFSTSSTGTKTLLGMSSSNLTYWHNTGLNNTTYYYWVTALNAAGESDYSTFVFAVTPPAAIQNLRQTNSTASSFTLAWNAVPGATRYDIRCSVTVYPGGYTIDYGTSVTGTTVTINNCSSQMSYYVDVEAYNANTGLYSVSSIIATTR
ncbi:MAG: choice-of-anchor D domain-containing protein [Treponema sp.]|nr:choice-of-anchor D domain-containing protein [Treponema sp.]MCL2252150.1 choice-of-anchor D domain-containing protein [Treponema sp.]